MADPEREDGKLPHENEKLEKKYADDLRTTIIRLIILGAAVLITGSTLLIVYRFRQHMRSDAAFPGNEAVVTPAPDYTITSDDVKDSMSVFIEAGRTAQMNISKCSYKNSNGIMKTFYKTDAVFLEAYIVSGIPDVKDYQATRLVLIYQETKGSIHLLCR